MSTRIRLKLGEHKDKHGEIVKEIHLPKGKVAFTIKMDTGEHEQFAFHEIHEIKDK